MIRYLIRTIQFAICYFLLCVNALSANTVVITDSTSEIHIPLSGLEILEDRSKSYSFKDISADSLQYKFHPAVSHSFFNNTRADYWIKLKFLNNSASYRKWLIQAPLHTEDIEYYIPSDNGVYKKFQAGQLINFSERQYLIRAIAFDLPSQRNKEYVVYMKMFSRSHIDLSFLVSDQNQYTNVLGKTNYFLGVIYGILLLMALYNFILYLSIREKIYVYYVLFTACAALLLSWKDGLGFEILWPELPHFNIFHHKISLFLVVLSFVWYALEFLELKKNSERLYKIAVGLLAVNFIYFFVVLFDPKHFDPLPVPYFVTLLFIYSIVIYHIVKRTSISNYLIVGSSFLLVALIVIKLRYMGLIEWNWFVEYVLNYAIVADVVAMSLAIRSKIAYMRSETERSLREKEKAQEATIIQLKENEKLKDKVNRELEKKVEERTNELKAKMEELNSANEKLKLSYEELGKMSAKLDLDNWNLKNDIKEERLLRINSERVSYKNFLELFPNETICLKLIYEKKWQENGSGYTCNRCGNAKNFDLSSLKFAKKCTKCNYIETVTANTLFHRVKFDMSKAFFIAYVTINYPDISITELSDEIELRKNTCWKFKKRVEEKLEEFKKKEKSSLPESWEELIIY